VELALNHRTKSGISRVVKGFFASGTNHWKRKISKREKGMRGVPNRFIHAAYTVLHQTSHAPNTYHQER